MRAFMDESTQHGGSHFVLAGCLATIETWADFSEDWDQLLTRYGRLDSRERYFHMWESTGDMESVQAFYRCMERHVPVFLSCRFKIADFKSAMGRICIAGAEVEWDYNIYFTAFRCLMDKFHLHRHEMVKVIPLEEHVEFFFDDTSDKVHISRAWDDYLANRPPETRNLYGPKPRFENDRVFKPLQAADLWAWWVRKWLEDGHPERINYPDFGTFQRSPNRPRATIDIHFEEEQFIPTLRRMAEAQAPGRQVTVLPK